MRNDLAAVLKAMRPTLTPNEDYVLVDRLDGVGPVIAAWNASGDLRPSDAEIAAYSIPVDVSLQLLDLAQQAQSRLTAIPYDAHTFDVSGGKEDLVHKWYSGAMAYGDLWGGGIWIHASTPYTINDAAECATWAMTLFAQAAAVHNARDAHELAINALTTQAEIDAYDVTANWP
jgi:hypothetical protein